MNVEVTLQKFYEAAKIPLQLFDDKKSIFTVTTKAFEPNPASLFMQNAIKSGADVCYTYSPEYLFSGFVHILLKR